MTEMTKRVQAAAPRARTFVGARLERDALAVPSGRSHALSPRESLAHAVDGADPGVETSGVLLGTHGVVRALAVSVIGVARAGDAADGVARASAEAANKESCLAEFNACLACMHACMCVCYTECARNCAQPA